MTYQTTPGLMIPPIINDTTAPVFTNSLLNAVDEKIAFLLTAPVTDDIISVSFRTSTVTTGGTVDVRIESIDLTTGDASGTLWDTNTNASQVIGNADDNTWFDVTLTAPASVSAGDIFALVIVVPSGFNGNIVSAGGVLNMGFPNVRQMTTVPTWGDPAGPPGPLCAIEYDTAGYAPMHYVFTFQSGTPQVYNNTSTPDVRGNKINLPFDCKTNGCWVLVDFDGDANINLYDSDGVTVLASGVVDADIPSGATAGTLNMVYFDSEVTLSASTDYRLAVEPSTGTSLSFAEYGFQSADKKAQQAGWQFVQATSANDPSGTGSWTDTSTAAYPCGLLISAIDIPVAGGGGLANAVFGGMVVR